MLAVGFAVADPERRVAEVNLARAEAGDGIDIAYLTSLSADAKDVADAFDWSTIGGRPPAVTRWLCHPPDTGYGLLGWNASVSNLGQPDPAAGCTPGP